MISIENNTESKLPLVPYSCYEELVKIFSTNNVLQMKFTNNDERVGYLKGVQDVLFRLKVLTGEVEL